MSKKLKAEFESRLLELERSINNDPAKAYGQLAALKESAKNAEQRQLLYCDVLMGRCLQRQGKSDEAFETISAATQKLVDLDAPRQTAMGYHFMSQICVMREETESAHEYCVRGLLIAEKAKDWYAQMLLKIDMSPIYVLLQDYKSALSIYLESKEIFEKHVKGKEPAIKGNEEYTAFIIELNVSFNYKKLQRYEEALAHLDSIADAANTVLNGMYLDKFHTEYASICLCLDRLDDAKKHTNSIIQLLTQKKLNFMPIAPNNYIALCQHLLANKIYDCTGKLLDLIREQAINDNNSYILRALYRTLAWYHKDIGETDKAAEYYELFAHYVDLEEKKQTASYKENVRRREELQKYADQRESIERSFNEGKKKLSAAQQASEAKGSFMSRMSHEIRTPLNAIIGYNEIAGKALADAKSEAERKDAIMRVMDCLNKCGIASRHLLTVINDVLDVSAIESGKIQLSRDRFDFKGMINSLTTVFYSQAKARGISLDIVLCELFEEWFVGDSLRVTQVFTNILSNAVKFTKEGGSVVMRITQREQEKTTGFHFEIEDSGIGMSEEYLKKIWEPFEQADASISRRFGGTGLGMTITKTLVDLMGGKIEVKSELGKGTTFLVDLEFERTEQPHAKNMYDFSTVNALVVDDDPVVCNYVSVLFSRCGARCTTVTSGANAIQAFKEAEKNNDNYSICLIDWKMPKMDGIETIKRIRKIAGKTLPLVVLSAYDYSEIADQAEKVGVDKFISKPIFQSSLFNLLADLCGIHSNDEKMARDRHYDFNGKRILLAEDNEMNMDIAKTILTSVNLEVECAFNGKIAFDMFTSSKEGYYELIFMDVQMPVMDGLEATRTIRKSTHPQAKSIPIIAMTADAFAENIAQSFEAGMNDHISKPFEPKHLFDTIAVYLSNDSKGAKG